LIEAIRKLGGQVVPEHLVKKELVRAPSKRTIETLVDEGHIWHDEAGRFSLQQWEREPGTREALLPSLQQEAKESKQEAIKQVNHVKGIFNHFSGKLPADQKKAFNKELNSFFDRLTRIYDDITAGYSERPRRNAAALSRESRELARRIQEAARPEPEPEPAPPPALIRKTAPPQMGLDLPFQLQPPPTPRAQIEQVERVKEPPAQLGIESIPQRKGATYQPPPPTAPYTGDPRFEPLPGQLSIEEAAEIIKGQQIERAEERAEVERQTELQEEIIPQFEARRRPKEQRAATLAKKWARKEERALPLLAATGQLQPRTEQEALEHIETYEQEAEEWKRERQERALDYARESDKYRSAVAAVVSPETLSYLDERRAKRPGDPLYAVSFWKNKFEILQEQGPQGLVDAIAAARRELEELAERGRRMREEARLRYEEEQRAAEQAERAAALAEEMASAPGRQPKRRSERARSAIERARRAVGMAPAATVSEIERIGYVGPRVGRTGQLFTGPGTLEPGGAPAVGAKRPAVQQTLFNPLARRINEIPYRKQSAPMRDLIDALRDLTVPILMTTGQREIPAIPINDVIDVLGKAPNPRTITALQKEGHLFYDDVDHVFYLAPFEIRGIDKSKFFRGQLQEAQMSLDAALRTMERAKELYRDERPYLSTSKKEQIGQLLGQASRIRGIQGQINEGKYKQAQQKAAGVLEAAQEAIRRLEAPRTIGYLGPRVGRTGQLFTGPGALEPGGAPAMGARRPAVQQTLFNPAYNFLDLDLALALEPEAAARGVSEVARSGRGFMRAYEAGQLGPDWMNKREGFIKRHLAQARQGGEPWFDESGQPTRRHLALAMWGYSPAPERLTRWARTANPARQKFTSAATARKGIPALVRTLQLPKGITNIDVGGGPYDGTTELLEKRGVVNLVYDPYSRSEAHNRSVVEELKAAPAQTATVANVLNVIKEPAARAELIRFAAHNIEPGGAAFFSVYEGNRSGRGRRTGPDQWQENRPVSSYIPEIKRYFGQVERRDNILIAGDPIQRRTNPLDFPPLEGRTKPFEVQSLLFSKAKWEPEEIIDWIERHPQFKFKKIDAGGPAARYYRVRQKDPGWFDEESLRQDCWSPGRGIQAVVGLPQTWEEKSNPGQLAAEVPARFFNPPQYITVAGIRPDPIVSLIDTETGEVMEAPGFKLIEGIVPGSGAETLAAKAEEKAKKGLVDFKNNKQAWSQFLEWNNALAGRLYEERGNVAAYLFETDTTGQMFEGVRERYGRPRKLQTLEETVKYIVNKEKIKNWDEFPLELITQSYDLDWLQRPPVEYIHETGPGVDELLALREFGAEEAEIREAQFFAGVNFDRLWRMRNVLEMFRRQLAPEAYDQFLQQWGQWIEDETVITEGVYDQFVESVQTAAQLDEFSIPTYQDIVLSEAAKELGTTVEEIKEAGLESFVGYEHLREPDEPEPDLEEMVDHVVDRLSVLRDQVGGFQVASAHDKGLEILETIKLGAQLDPEWVQIWVGEATDAIDIAEYKLKKEGPKPQKPSVQQGADAINAIRDMQKSLSTLDGEVGALWTPGEGSEEINRLMRYANQDIHGISSEVSYFLPNIQSNQMGMGITQEDLEKMSDWYERAGETAERVAEMIKEAKQIKAALPVVGAVDMETGLERFNILDQQISEVSGILTDKSIMDLHALLKVTPETFTDEYFHNVQEAIYDKLETDAPVARDVWIPATYDVPVPTPTGEKIRDLEGEAIGGLIVHPSLRGEGWTVGHRKSGGRISYHPGYEGAKQIARRLSSVMNWNRDIRDLQADNPKEFAMMPQLIKLLEADPNARIPPELLFMGAARTGAMMAKGTPPEFWGGRFESETIPADVPF
jgi:hypothetical protein